MILSLFVILGPLGSSLHRVNDLYYLWDEVTTTSLLVLVPDRCLAQFLGALLHYTLQEV